MAEKDLAYAAATKVLKQQLVDTKQQLANSEGRLVRAKQTSVTLEKQRDQSRLDAAAAARALRFLAGVFLGSSGSAASSGRSSGSLGHFDEVCYRSGSLWIDVDRSGSGPAPFRSVLLLSTSDPPPPTGPGRRRTKWAEVGRSGPMVRYSRAY